MAQRRFVKRGAAILAVVVLTGGCNRQDADCLARIGNLLAQRAQTLKQKSAANKHLTRALPDLGITEPAVGAANVNGDPEPAK